VWEKGTFSFLLRIFIGGLFLYKVFYQKAFLGVFSPLTHDNQVELSLYKVFFVKRLFFGGVLFLLTHDNQVGLSLYKIFSIERLFLSFPRQPGGAFSYKIFDFFMRVQHFISRPNIVSIKEPV